MGDVQREISQSRPFRSPSQEAAVALLRTADMVRRHYGRVLEPYDLTLQQYNVLRILRGAGEDGLPTLTIGDRMVERAPGVTRIVDRLVEKGWVERRRGREDRRKVLCSVTPGGSELLAELDDVIDEADEGVMAGLDEAGTQRLVELLDRVRRRLRGLRETEGG